MTKKTFCSLQEADKALCFAEAILWGALHVALDRRIRAGEAYCKSFTPEGLEKLQAHIDLTEEEIRARAEVGDFCVANAARLFAEDELLKAVRAWSEARHQYRQAYQDNMAGGTLDDVRDNAEERFFVPLVTALDTDPYPVSMVDDYVEVALQVFRGQVPPVPREPPVGGPVKLN